jgi:hypothetical protein
MSYRNVDYTKKKKSKSSAKKSKVLRDEKGTFEWELKGPRHRRKKKYLTNFSDVKAKAKKDMTSNKAYPLPFGETFRQAKARGDKTFRWKNKQYHTKTKDELEKAKAEPKESKTYLMKQETGMLAKAEPKKKGLLHKLGEKVKSFRKKTTGYETQTEWEDAKAKRKVQKRIDRMKKRKNQGKNYSAKNLAELQEKIKGM